MTGNILIKGNLYLNDDYVPSKLSENGITIHVKEDVYFFINIKEIELKDDDVFIEEIFDKLKIKDIIAYSAIF